MNTAIITDSTCDFDQDIATVLNIDIVPLLVAFGESTFQDGLDISKEEFFARLSKAHKLPSTSQPSPAVFQAIFRQRLGEGKDIIGIFLSSVLSGTYQSAMMARSFFSVEEQQRIFLIDSKHGTGSMALIVLEACKLRDTGKCADDITQHINRIIPRIKLYAMLDTLKYLKMGGRLSGAAVTVSSILNIAPVLTLLNGTITATAKIRKNHHSFSKWLREKLSNGPPDPQFTTVFIHGNHAALAAALIEDFKHLIPKEKSINLCMGAVIGTHVGPNAYGMAYVPLEK